MTPTETNNEMMPQALTLDAVNASFECFSPDRLAVFAGELGIHSARMRSRSEIDKAKALLDLAKIDRTPDIEPSERKRLRGAAVERVEQSRSMLKLHEVIAPYLLSASALLRAQQLVKQAEADVSLLEEELRSRTAGVEALRSRDGRSIAETIEALRKERETATLIVHSCNRPGERIDREEVARNLAALKERGIYKGELSFEGVRKRVTRIEEEIPALSAKARSQLTPQELELMSREEGELIAITERIRRAKLDLDSARDIASREKASLATALEIARAGAEGVVICYQLGRERRELPELLPIPAADEMRGDFH